MIIDCMDLGSLTLSGRKIVNDVISTWKLTARRGNDDGSVEASVVLRREEIERMSLWCQAVLAGFDAQPATGCKGCVHDKGTVNLYDCSLGLSSIAKPCAAYHSELDVSTGAKAIRRVIDLLNEASKDADGKSDPMDDPVSQKQINSVYAAIGKHDGAIRALDEERTVWSQSLVDMIKERDADYERLRARFNKSEKYRAKHELATNRGLAALTSRAASASKKLKNQGRALARIDDKLAAVCAIKDGKPWPRELKEGDIVPFPGTPFMGRVVRADNSDDTKPIKVNIGVAPAQEVDELKQAMMGAAALDTAIDTSERLDVMQDDLHGIRKHQDTLVGLYEECRDGIAANNKKLKTQEKMIQRYESRVGKESATQLMSQLKHSGVRAI